MVYEILKFVHVVGVVLLVGNVTITAFWKVFADRTGEPRLVAHSQHIVTLSDWIFTLAGILMIVVGGYGMVFFRGWDLLATRWLVWGQLLFFVSGLIWIFVLIPAQIRQARQARAFNSKGPIPNSYWRDGRLWLTWGIVATIPLVAAIYVMIAKP